MIGFILNENFAPRRWFDEYRPYLGIMTPREFFAYRNWPGVARVMAPVIEQYERENAQYLPREVPEVRVAAVGGRSMSV